MGKEGLREHVGSQGLCPHRRRGVHRQGSRGDPANAAESPRSGTMIGGSTAQPVLAGKACASKANRAALKGQHRDGIMRKAARNRPLRQSEKRFNKQISRRRFRVEQCLGTMKGPFGLHRARCFGVARTHAQMVMAAIPRNLLKAANRITLIQKTPPIAQTGNAEQIRLKTRAGNKTQTKNPVIP